MSRLVSWFATKNGRRFAHFSVGVAAVAAFGNQIAINGPWLEKFQEICQVYKRGKPRPLPQKVINLAEEVLQESTLKEEEKKKIKFFYVIGHELFHAGGTNSPWGAMVGIPFTFEDIEDINFGQLRLQGKEAVDWIIDGQDLIKALTISDSAKKFALMRELYSCDFSLVLENATISSGCILVAARLAQMWNHRTKALEKFSFPKRSVYYIFFYACGLLLYRCLKDPLKHISDKKADEMAARAGPEYLNGGIEYYEKALMKNKALKELPGSMYKKRFDEQGNENYFLLAPKLPIRKRLELLRDMKEEKVKAS